MFSAKALYSNVADTPDELSFSKGDVLEVLEKDDNGWWVCSLKGKVGIAPGNRLQRLSTTTGSRGVSPSGRNSPSASQVLPPGLKLPSSGSAVHLGQKSPATDQGVRSNWHRSNKVVVPVKSGNVYVYDSPNRVLQDYDVPPARHDGKPGGIASVTPTQLNRGPASYFDSSDALQNYDVPSSLRCSVQAASQLPDNYDTLPGFTRSVSRLERDALSSNNASMLIYDIPPAFLEMEPALASNRSSVLSVLSTGSQSSACSGHSSLGGSVSARSSVDVSTHEIYDVPLSSRVMSGSETGRQLQTLAEQGILDDVGVKSGVQSVASSPYAKKEFGRQNSAGPPCSLKLHVDRDSYLEDYSIPRSDFSHGSGDSGISVSTTDPFTSRSCSDELYDTPRKVLTDAGQKHELSLPKSEELTYDVPNQNYYDLPNRNNYEVPDQNNYCSRDTNDSIESASLELSFMELVDNGAQISNPTDALVALQSTALGHSSKLVSLISRLLSGGRNQEQELSQIKLACLALKSALKEVLDFGSGGFVQALDSSNKELSEKAFQLLEKVRVQQQYLNRHIDRLLTTQWPPRRLDKTLGEISELDDTLNIIGMLTEAVSGHLQTLTRFLQNSTLLFKRNAVENGISGHDLNRTSKDDDRCHRPPLPPATKTKPKFGQDSTEKQSQVQDRPLPPVPCRASNTPDYRISRQHSVQAAVQVTPSGSAFQANNSIEWNDDCDYVSIANEAEKEMKAHEKLLDQKESDRTVAGCDNRQDPRKEIVLSGENSPNGLYLENNGLSPTCKEKLLAVPKSAMLTDPGVATSGNTDPLVSTSKADTPENGHAVDCIEPDPQLMAFYAEQTDTHFTVIDSAVREFFQMIFSDRVTAKEFLLRSKYVILAAHKLVYIGDTITRNSVNSSAQNQITLCANNLCDILKETVAATKTSALNFPHNLTQQKLIDCMKAVSQASLQLCEAIRSKIVQV